MVAIIVILSIMLLAFVNFTYIMYHGIENPTKLESWIIKTIISLYSYDWKSVKAVFLAVFYCLFFFWLFCQIAGITLKN